MHPDESDLSHDDIESQLSHYRTQVGAVSFNTGFADRVMARLEAASRTTTLADGLQRVFWRLTPLAMAAVFALAAMNLFSTRATTQPLVDRVLGLSVATVASTDAVDADFSGWGN